MRSRVINGAKQLIEFTGNNYNNIILGSAMAGANVGAYYAAKSDEGYVFGVVSGGLVGATLGAVSPIIIPGLAIAGPGYLAAKAHSFLLASRQKGGRQAG